MNDVKILLIEDEESDIRLFKETLAQYDNVSFDITVEKTAKGAIDRLKKNECFDVIVTDIILPDNRDLSIIKDIKYYNNGSPILVLSNLDDDFVIEKAINNGAYALISKSEFNGNLKRAIIAAKASGIIKRQRNLELINTFKTVLSYP